MLCEEFLKDEDCKDRRSNDLHMFVEVTDNIPAKFSTLRKGRTKYFYELIENVFRA